MEDKSRPTLLQITDKVKEHMQGISADHDMSHIDRVTKNAMHIAIAPFPNRLSTEQTTIDMELIMTAATLHDVDDHKLFPDSENFANARRILKEVGYDDKFSDKVCHIIEQVSFSKNAGKIPDSVEAMVVQDADRLDSIGAIGIARTFAYSGAHGRSLEDSIEHFYSKLFKIKDMLNTTTARQMAGARHELMKHYIFQYMMEAGISLERYIELQNAYL